MITQASIQEEIRDWSKEVLETEDPVCPFAKKNVGNRKSKRSFV